MENTVTIIQAIVSLTNAVNKLSEQGDRTIRSNIIMSDSLDTLSRQLKETSGFLSKLLSQIDSAEFTPLISDDLLPIG